MNGITGAIEWLDARKPPAPEDLLHRLRRALQRHGDPQADLTHILADTGIALLQNALRVGSDRSAAFDLLGADALLTYAFEAAAEQGVDAVIALAQEYGLERFEPIAAAHG